MIRAPILVVGGLIMALRQDVPLTGVLLVIIPIMVAADRDRDDPRDPAVPGDADQDRPDQPGDARDARRASASSAPSSGPEHEEQRFDEASLDLMDTGLRVNRLFAITLPALMLIMNLSTVAVLWLGAYRVDSGAMPIGNLTAFLQYIIADPVRDHDRGDHVHHGPAGRRLGRPDPRGARHRAHRSPTRRRPISPIRARRGRVPRRRVRLPGRRGAGPPEHLVPRPTRARRRPSSGPRAAASPR